MPAEDSTRVSFTIKKKLKAEAEECAKEEHRSFSNLISVALEEYIKNKK